MDNIRITILSGIPGSGKSTWWKEEIRRSALWGSFVTVEHFTKKYAGEHPITGKKEAIGIVSADHYFMRDGEYKFDPSKLSAAHGECLLGFMRLLMTDLDFCDAEDGHVIVDNTNTTVLEIAPYMAIASAHNVPVTLHTFKCVPKVGAERNKHGVSLQGCVRMAENIERRDEEFPPFWRFKHIVHHDD